MSFPETNDARPPRTSVTDPLKIATITHGELTLGITMMPGRKGRSMTGPAWDRDLDADLSVIREWNAKRIMFSVPRFQETLTPGEPDDDYPPVSKTVDATGASFTLLYSERDGVPCGSPEEMSESADRAIAGLNGRVLMISERGLHGAGTLAAIMLRRRGLSSDEAISMVNSARPDSITTIAQKEYIAQISARLEGLPYQDRERQSPGILLAKHYAESIQKSGLSRTQALEQHARNSGWKNWSTMSAALAGPGRPYPGGRPDLEGLHKALSLDTGSAEIVTGKIVDLCGFPDDMWGHRANSYLMACVAGLFDLHARSGTEVSFETLRASFHFEGPIGIVAMVRAYDIGSLTGPGRDAVMRYCASHPSFMRKRAGTGEKQDMKSVEQAGFLSMQITRPLCRLKEDWFPQSDPSSHGGIV